MWRRYLGLRDAPTPGRWHATPERGMVAPSLTVEAGTSMPVSGSPAYCFCNCKELLHCRGLSVRAKARPLGSLGDYSVPNIDKYGTDMPSYLCFRMHDREMIYAGPEGLQSFRSH